jgi:hypothetical protein
LATFEDGGAIWAEGIAKLEGVEEFALRCFLLFGYFEFENMLPTFDRASL